MAHHKAHQEQVTEHAEAHQDEAPTLPVAPTPQVVEPLALPTLPQPPPTVATVGVPTTAMDELAKLLPANGQIGGMTVILAAIAVLGGGAAWKFYSQRSKEKHEEKLKEMELQASQPTQQHPTCKMENEAIHADLRRLNENLQGVSGSIQNVSASIQEVAQRVAKLEAKVESPDLPEGLENLGEMEDRIKKLERAIKPPRKTKT